MVRLSLPLPFRKIPPRRPQLVSCNVQRQCGHYETVFIFAARGMWDAWIAERRLYCAHCRVYSVDPTLLAMAPKLRIRCAYDVWGVERLMATARGVGFELVAILTSYEQCIEWIGNTFAGRCYEIVEELI